MIAPVLSACKKLVAPLRKTIETHSPFCPAIEKEQMYRCRREYTAARGRGNFSSLLLNVAGGNVGYFSDKVIRRLIE